VSKNGNFGLTAGGHQAQTEVPDPDILADGFISLRTSRWSTLAAMGGVIVVFLIASALLSSHRAPWWDEGVFADPSSNLALKGLFGSTRWHTYVPGRVPELPATGQYTYWQMPLYLLSLAGLFHTFGFSILTMRVWSMWWGCVLIVSWYFIVLALSKGSRLAGLLAAAFVGVNTVVILAAAVGRPDCMTAALGAAGMAFYLQLRQSRLTVAVLAGVSCEVAAFFTHPIAVVHAGPAVMLALLLDWKRLRIRQLLVGSIPVIVALLGYGAYIARAPHVFQAQFLGHSLGRVSGLSSPFRALVTEFQARYIGYFWTDYHGIMKFKVLLLAPYLASCAFLLVAPAIRRRQPGLRLLVLLGVSAYVLLAIFDSLKGPVYLIHTFSYFAAACGVTVWWLTSEVGPRKIWITAAAALIALQLSAVAYKIRQDTNARIYLPVVDYVRNHSLPGAFIIAPTELLFGLGPNFHLEDDPRFGSRTARAPDMIVSGPFSADARDFQAEEPQTAQFIRQRLTHEYTMVFQNEQYRVYLPNPN
jgi:hypothetical protein